MSDVVSRGSACLMSTYARIPIELVSGRGARVFDREGRAYLDLVSGIAVNVLGHSHPALVAAAREAAGALWHVSNLYWTEPMVRLAERLTFATGMDRAFFCNSGAEAVEAALKLARRARPGRSRIVAFERSFHGRTLGALSATAQPHYQDAFRPLLAGFEILPHGDFDRAAAAIDTDTAAVIVEPIQGEGGVRAAPDGWLAHLRSRCDQAGALLVFDEVQSGVGRTGTFLACQGEGVVPDAVALAKALAGGLPMGALLARGEAAGTFRPGDHASTFGGGPFVASVANAVLDVVLADGFLGGVRERAARLERGLRAIAASAPSVAEVRGRGLMRGLALHGEFAAAVTDALRARGVLAMSAGRDVLRLLPPLVIEDAEIDEAVRAVGDALEEVGAPVEVRS
jgi:predicted acetylornithine/succinylornithine family transaminase